jgi:tetrahydromethanopterin S-methyltransferase subunit B
MDYEIDQLLKKEDVNPESDDFKEFVKEAIARKMFQFSEDPVLNQLEEFAALAAVSESQKDALNKQLQNLEDRWQAQIDAFGEDVLTAIKTAELSRAEALERERQEAEQRELEEAKLKAEQQSPAEGDSKAPKDESKQESNQATPPPVKEPEASKTPQPQAVTRTAIKPQSELTMTIDDDNEDGSVCKLAFLGEDHKDLQTNFAKLSEVERVRLLETDTIAQLNHIYEEKNRVALTLQNWNNQMAFLQGHIRRNCLEAFNRAAEEKEHHMYRAPLGTVYHTLHGQQLEKIAMLEQQLAEHKTKGERAEDLAATIGELKTKLEAAEAQAEALRELEDQRRILGRAKEVERQAEELQARVEDLQTKLEVALTDAADLRKREQADKDAAFKKREQLNDRLEQLEAKEAQKESEFKARQDELSELAHHLEEKEKDLAFKTKKLESREADLKFATQGLRYGASTKLPNHRSPRLFGQEQKAAGGPDASDLFDNTLPLFGGDNLDVRGPHQPQAGLNRSAITNKEDLLADIAAQKKELQDLHNELDLKRSEYSKEKQRQEVFATEKETLEKKVKSLTTEVDRLRDQLNPQKSFSVVSAQKRQNASRDYFMMMVGIILTLGIAGIAYFNIRGCRYPGEPRVHA